jgi:MSHA pilin protein MshD
MKPTRRQAGMTLIELLLSMVIISVALAGVLMVMNATASRSADPMITEQATAIAEAYMEEIITKAFVDPNGEGEEAGRATWDDVNDYAAIGTQVPTDQYNDPVGLGGYSVTVAIGAAAPVAGEPMIPVTVTVVHPGAGVSVTLNGYRSAL